MGDLVIFWRMIDGKNYPLDETDVLGFEESEGLRIPDEYLDEQKFIVMRTHGIGDWGILSHPKITQDQISKL